MRTNIDKSNSGQALRVIDEAAGNPLHCDVVEPIPAQVQGLDFHEFRGSSLFPTPEPLQSLVN